MKTDSQRLSQNMICAGLGRLTTALWHWLQVAMAAWGEASAAEPDLHPELCPTHSWLLKAAAASSPAPAGSQDAGTRSAHDFGHVSTSWALLLLHSLFPDWPWGIAHRGTPYTSVGYRQDLLHNHHHKLQIKPQGRWKDLRKGHLILFLLKIKVSSQFFTRYDDLVTLQGKHK